jgi:hypothetical protein
LSVTAATPDNDKLVAPAPVCGKGT